MARTDFEPLTWEEAEQNRLECLDEHFSPIPRGPSPLAPSPPPAARPQAASPSGPAPLHLSESPAERAERLRGEIKRGREYRDQAEKDLAERRAQLESWPAYERICGKNPLENLTRSAMVSERIAGFLAGWLERREAELAALTRYGQAPAVVPNARAPKARVMANRKELAHRGPKRFAA
jgi:hypothetical protein